MSKPKKIRRNVKIYQSKKVSHLKQIITVLFILLVVFLGYIAAGPILEIITSDDKGASSNTDVSKNDVDNSQSSSNDKSDVSDTSSGSNDESQDTTSDTGNKSEKPLNAVEMPIQKLVDESSWTSYFADVKSQGYTGVIVPLKDEIGTLYYKTAVELATTVSAVATNAVDLTALYSAIDNAKLTPIASINTLKDKIAPHATRNNSYLYGTSGTVTWYDNAVNKGGKPWLNPYMENARNYIVDICNEISTAGFKTILLDTLQFPDGNMSKINLVNEFTTKAEILNQLIQEVNSSIAPNDAKAIPVVNATAYLGVNNNKYGGEPSLFVGDSVVVDLSYDELAKVSLPEAYTGLSVAQNYNEVIKVLFEGIKLSSSEVCVLLDSKNQEQTKTTLQELNINDIFMHE